MIVEIQIYLRQQRARVVLDADRKPNRYMEFEISPEMICGRSDDDALYVGAHLIEALKITGKVHFGDELRVVNVLQSEVEN